MNCDELRRLFAKHEQCEMTDSGLRFATHCYYPSMDRVWVYVSELGDGFRVSDGGEAARAAFINGRDDEAFDASLRRACKRYGLDPHEGALVAEVREAEWIFPAILAVANGASQAASETSLRVSERRLRVLKALMRDTLGGIVPSHRVATDYMFRGNSGRLWRLDYAVVETRIPLLLKAILPERNSINSNYATFGDIAEIKEDDARRFSVFDSPLEPVDTSLMLQVAELVPVKSLEKGARSVLEASGI
jgi:hypothetical protein